MSEFPAMHLTQVQKLDRLMSKDFNEATGEGPQVPLPEVIALGIGPYSRRFEDLRKIYRPMGFDVVNTIERGDDGITRSWYQKRRVGFPSADRAESPYQKERHSSRRKTPVFAATVRMKSWAEVCQERDANLARAQQAPELVLRP